jgi:hypothetical protein
MPKRNVLAQVRQQSKYLEEDLVGEGCSKLSDDDFQKMLEIYLGENDSTEVSFENTLEKSNQSLEHHCSSSVVHSLQCAEDEPKIGKMHSQATLKKYKLMDYQEFRMTSGITALKLALHGSIQRSRTIRKYFPQIFCNEIQVYKQKNEDFLIINKIEKYKKVDLSKADFLAMFDDIIKKNRRYKLDKMSAHEKEAVAEVSSASLLSYDNKVEGSKKRNRAEETAEPSKKSSIKNSTR